MIVTLVLLASGVIAMGAAAAAIVSDPANDYRGRVTRAENAHAGAAGERRVARALQRAGVAAVHDITLPDRAGGTHQIDHIAAAGDCLYVLETKNWHGTVSGDAGSPEWTLRAPSGTVAHPYNPLLQNDTHQEVLRELTHVPVQGLVIEVGRTRHRDGRPPRVMPLHAAIVKIARCGPPSTRATADLEDLARIKKGPREVALVAAHRHSVQRQLSEKTRRLWHAAAVAALVFIVVVAARFYLV